MTFPKTKVRGDVFKKSVKLLALAMMASGLGTGCILIEGYEPCAEVEDDCALNPLLGDRIDNDCDGIVDEGCGCDYRGFMRGVCVDGTVSQTEQVCAIPRDFVEDERGQCDGLDNDCDGQVDEGCRCDVDGSSAGVCALGTFVETGVCTPPVLYQMVESSCDGYDNDCNGQVDEGCQTCNFKGLLVGVCAHGQIVDDRGSMTCGAPDNYVDQEDDCASDPYAGDGVDNDCDGEIDEGCACNYGDVVRGVCSRGRRVNDSCSPPPEYKLSESNSVCDGLDNDCDGYVDNDCVPAEE